MARLSGEGSAPFGTPETHPLFRLTRRSGRGTPDFRNTAFGGNRVPRSGGSLAMTVRPVEGALGEQAYYRALGSHEVKRAHEFRNQDKARSCFVELQRVAK